MGNFGSAPLENLSTNELLLKLVGKDTIVLEDPFWENLLSFKSFVVGTDIIHNIFVERKQLFGLLTLNNLTTGNFGTLLQVFLIKAADLTIANKVQYGSIAPYAHNALFIARQFLQHLIYTYPEDDVIRQIETIGKGASLEINNSPLAVQFINCLMDILVTLPEDDDTYLLHCEAINVLLTLLSIELFTTETPMDLKIYNMIFTYEKEEFTTVLLMRFIQKRKYPSEEASSFFGIGNIIVALLSQSEDEGPGPYLYRNAALLLIVLVNQHVGDQNPFRELLANIPDQYFEKIYTTVCRVLDKEETTLLLYHLLHRNEQFKLFVLAQNDIEALVVPMLHGIYHANDSSCHHMYMLLIILLILTEDSDFNKKVHFKVLKNVSWYTDRHIPDITLGGLIILVTTRTVQYNLLKMRDEYLHTNCLAALANMSSQFSNLNPYVCQRLVGLFEILAKTYNRAKQELVAIEKALRIILEVLNSCLSNQLVSNTNLIYALLYNRQIFDTFKENPAFQDIINNINQVLEYFISKIDNEQKPCTDVVSVINVIIEASPKWPSHRLQKFPELRFKYVEEEKPEMFFIPYVWSLVNDYSNVYLPSLFNKSEVQNV